MAALALNKLRTAESRRLAIVRAAMTPHTLPCHGACIRPVGAGQHFCTRSHTYFSFGRVLISSRAPDAQHRFVEWAVGGWAPGFGDGLLA